jgi:hypothetical protein
MDSLISWLVILAIAIFYFLPTFAAHKKSHQIGVFILNIFFGWTIIGWIVCLIWAFSGKNEQSTGPNYIFKCPQCGYQKTIQSGLLFFFCDNCKLKVDLRLKT